MYRIMSNFSSGHSVEIHGHVMQKEYSGYSKVSGKYIWFRIHFLALLFIIKSLKTHVLLEKAVQL